MNNNNNNTPDYHRFVFTSQTGAVLQCKININGRDSTAVELIDSVPPQTEIETKWCFEDKMLLKGEMQLWLRGVEDTLRELVSEKEA